MTFDEDEEEEEEESAVPVELRIVDEDAVSDESLPLKCE